MKRVAAFQATGVHLAGPLYLCQGCKAWIVLLTCAVYIAVHLEYATSMSSETFMQAMRRFFARRGRCSMMYSDNGTNLTGTSRALQSLDWESIQAECALQRINSAHLQHHGMVVGGRGWLVASSRFYESALVKLVLTYDEMLTLLCDGESVINTLTGHLPPEKLFRKRLTLILRFPSKMQQTFFLSPFRTWVVERGKFYDPVRCLCKKSAANPLLKTLLEGRKIRAVHFRSLSSRAEKSVLFSWRVNGRSLTCVSDDPNETTAITPAHFIQDIRGSEVHDLDIIDSKHVLKRVRYLQNIRDNLRKRFQKEYLGELVRNPKSTSKRKEITALGKLFSLDQITLKD
ncbi:integrase catalytic domain-containing protein [Trichonephila clavipes]|nr:integrase catalytic domain-containing protein [Trichonephila clavipes]